MKVGCGLFCEYCPQDKYIENYKSRYPGQKKVLDEETFYSAISNVPITTLIKWTGFTEPLDSKYFPVFVNYVHEHGYKQVISTTLHGTKNSVAWFCENINLFEQITLHLPDDNSLMKSRVDKEYLLALSHVLDRAHSLGMKEDRLVIFLIGESFHRDIGKIVDNFLQEGKIKASQIQKAEVLNTRNSTVDVSKLSIKMFVQEAPLRSPEQYKSETIIVPIED